MKNIKHVYILLAIILPILAFLFYWFQIKPINIRKKCIKEAVESARKGTYMNLHGSYEDQFRKQCDWFYEKCCRVKGITP